MPAFLVGHATHGDWRAALALAAAQIEARLPAFEAAAAGSMTLGFVYFSDHYAAHAQGLYDELRRRWPAVTWVGSVGVGVCAGSAEYMDEPALALMLTDVPADGFEVFSGAHKLQQIDAFGALVHADPATPELPELITELSQRTRSGYLFGGLASSRSRSVHVAGGVWQGGLSGVAFTDDVAIVSRVTQGCQPVGPTREVTACDRNLITALDGQPALDCLLGDLGLGDVASLQRAPALARLRATLVGLTDAQDMAIDRGGQFGTDVRVRHLIGLDPARHAVAVADLPRQGMRATFCQRDAQAARRDLVRICSEIREEIESATVPALVAGAAPPARRSIRGAVYVSCTGRGGAHFGGPSAELRTVQHALSAGGDEVPLVGFFAAGEIARHHLYGYTGVLTVFTGSED
ncbi:MAG TPA: FIST N-terminal domain-containing protein [Rubrivivax sp.]|nr:FIST N-terminal domain-containing protein [Rubrivivax sp.]